LSPNSDSKPDRIPAHLGKVFQGKVLTRLNGQYVTPSDERLINEDCDVLVIIDACRYDILNDINPFDTECDARISHASETFTWFSGNFAHIRPNEA